VLPLKAYAQRLGIGEEGVLAFGQPKLYTKLL